MAQHKELFPLFPTLEIKRLKQKNALNGVKIKTGFAICVKHKKNKRHEGFFGLNTQKRGRTCLKRLLKAEYS